MMTQKYPKLINVGSLIRSVVGKKFPKLINVGCTFIRNARVSSFSTAINYTYRSQQEEKGFQSLRVVVL